MIRIFNCIIDSHDLNLTVLAAVLCVVSSTAGVTLVKYANDAKDGSRWIWLGISSVATGSGIWATHFVAMLAFCPNLPTSYDPGLTAISFVVANALAIAGFALAMTRNSMTRQIAGGLVLGAGIAAMHFTGMTAYRIQGVLLWNEDMVFVAVAFGLVVAAIAMPVALRANSATRKLLAAIILTVAISGHHLLAMSAISVVPDVDVPASNPLSPVGWIATVVAIASTSIAALALIGVSLDAREKRRISLENSRLVSLAEAAIDGLIICDQDKIVTVNNNFANVTEAEQSELIGSNLGRWVTDDMCRTLAFSRPNLPVETVIRNSKGQQIPVELVLRPIELHGKPHQAIAIRDLRYRREAEQRMQFLAQHDSLTGLCNRIQLGRTLDMLIESANEVGASLAIYSINLDRFKQINDTFGQDCGDFFLVKIAQRLREAVGANDFIARSGGDEFVVIQPNVATPGHAESLSAYLASLIAEPVEFGGRVLKTTASIGVSFAPSDGNTSEEVLRSADLALERAKLTRNCVRIFSPEMDETFRDRVHLAEAIARAVTEDGFVLHYQPIVRSREGEVVGFEALIRMKSDDGRLISPATFIPVAEDLQLLGQIGAWALREACLAAKTWPDDLFVAVNLSPTQFGNGSIAALVAKTIVETGLPAQRLELEITENLLLDHNEQVMAELHELRDLGVRIVMDDFGTGYSSLSYLWKFPFDKLKVDRSFMADFGESGARVKTVLRSIVGLGRELKMHIVVEGVETGEQVEFLKSIGGDQAQGYFFGTPMPGIDVPFFIVEKASLLREQNGVRASVKLELVN